MICLCLLGGLPAENNAGGESRCPTQIELQDTPCPRAEMTLQGIPFRIVYETYRKKSGRQNWELHLIDAGGSHPANLTQTPDVDEMYPHVSPDGSKICFVADELVNGEKIRNVYYMNIDGTERVKVAGNARQPCWSPDSKTIAYLKGEFDRYTTRDFATKGIFFYDLKAGKHKEHPNKGLHHLYNICWSPDGKYIAFSYGPKANEQVGCKAPGWDICVSDMSGKYVEITTDGNHNKEPDWVPIRALIR
jgi:Tol biopolymer transport system component